jgi:hypothetical protein
MKSKTKVATYALAAVAVVILGALLAGHAIHAAEAGKTGSPVKRGDSAAEVKPVLAPVAGVVARVRALKKNELAKLPIASVAGNFNDIARKYKLEKNGPGIRDYCLKMPWAADRKRALFCGGNHGVPHGLNDIWEYDLPSNTWYLLWAPDDFTRKPWGRWKDAVIKDGVLQSKRGATAQAAHTWDQVTYDPEMGALIWLTAWNIGSNLKSVGLLEKWKKENRHKVPLWAYYPAKNKWKPLGVGQSPKRANNASLLCYIPELKGTIYYGKWGYKTFLWVAATDKWKPLAGRGHGPGSEMLSCYDSTNKVVVALASNSKGGGTYHFDPAKKAWSRAAVHEAGKTPQGMDMFAVIGHDPASGHCLLYTNRGSAKTKGFWAYDAKAAKWSKLNPTGAKLPTGGRRKPLFNGYFDPARNVFVLFRGGGREVWAYRYKEQTTNDGKK